MPGTVGVNANLHSICAQGFSSVADNELILVTTVLQPPVAFVDATGTPRAEPEVSESSMLWVCL